MEVIVRLDRCGMVVCVALVLAACSGGEDPVKVGTDDPSTATAGPTFAQDVLPMLADNCTRCHGASALASLDFTDPAVASAWAPAMVQRIQSGEMPPPAPDPDCHPYRGSEHLQLDPALEPLLIEWIDAGTPIGDLASAPAIEPWVPTALSRRDLELRPPADYVPQFVDANEYRCFLVDDVEAATWVTGIEALVDNATISHHAVLFVDPDAGSEANVQDPATRSWSCPEVLPEDNWQFLNAWAPSGEAVEFPAGMGMKLEAGSQLVLQMHYFTSGGEPPADRPGYGLMLADEVEDELFYLALGPESFRIPAGDASFTETLELPMEYLTYGGFSLDVYGLMPHMHVLGASYDFTTTSPGGEESCISRADDYDFSMQPTWWFDEPVRIGASDLLTVSCTWDNSATNPRQLSDPPQDVTWGENTQEEMCYALMYAAIRY